MFMDYKFWRFGEELGRGFEGRRLGGDFFFFLSWDFCLKNWDCDLEIEY